MNTDLLKKIMADRGWNQLRLAAELGVSPSHISKIIHGTRRLGIDLVFDLSAMTSIPVEEFFKGEPR